MNYYEIGTKENPVISNSSLSALNPIEGGSPRRFMSFFDEREEEKETTALNRGKLLHNYMENKDLFAISTVEKPSGDMGKFVDELYKNIQAYKNAPELFDADISTVISSEAKREATKSAEIIETQSAYTDLSNILQLTVDETIKLFRLTRIKGDYYSSYKEATTIERVKNTGLDYFNALKALEGKVILTKADKEALDGAINSLYTNSKIVNLLNLDNKPLNEAAIRFIKEATILFDSDVELENNRFEVVPCKIKPDIIRIHDANKSLLEIDLKTTTNLYTFQKSFDYYNYDRQHSFYRRGLSKHFTGYSITHYNVVVETQGLFQSGIYKVGQSYLNQGAQKVDSLLNRYAWHKNTGIWNTSMEEHLGNGIMTLEVEK